MPNGKLPRDFQEALRQVQDLLCSRQDRNPEEVTSDAEQLVIAAVHKVNGIQLSRIQFYSQIREPLSPSVAKKIIEFSNLRLAGIPLQHVTGVQYFLNHEYEVTSDVLIPRPETEVLVDFAIRELERSSTSPQLGIEIGLGSGIISIELLSRFPNLKMIATELSLAAREIALRNAEKILGKGPSGKDRLKIILVGHPHEVWKPIESLSIQADFLISNPPYLATDQEVTSEVLKHEPHMALFAPQEDPLFFYRMISTRSNEFLKKEGDIFLELPHERSAQILKLFEASSLDPKVILDLNQRERVLHSKVREQNG